MIATVETQAGLQGRLRTPTRHRRLAENMNAATPRRGTIGGRLLVRLASGTGALLLAVASFGRAPSAGASLGYEPASPSTIAVQGEEPLGVAIDQANQDIYV